MSKEPAPRKKQTPINRKRDYCGCRENRAWLETGEICAACNEFFKSRKMPIHDFTDYRNTEPQEP